MCRYGHNFWALIYQAEARMGREHMERLGRKELLLHSSLGSASRSSLEYPWGTLFRSAVEDRGYWQDHLKEPRLMAAAQARTVENYAQGGRFFTGGVPVGLACQPIRKRI